MQNTIPEIHELPRLTLQQDPRQPLDNGGRCEETV